MVACGRHVDGKGWVAGGDGLGQGFSDVLGAGLRFPLEVEGKLSWESMVPVPCSSH